MMLFPVILSDSDYLEPPHFWHFVISFISLLWVEMETSN